MTFAFPEKATRLDEAECKIATLGKPHWCLNKGKKVTEVGPRQQQRHFKDIK